MTFWIYNLGMGVALAEKSFSQQYKVMPLQELAKTHRLYQTDEEKPLQRELTDNSKSKNSSIQKQSLESYQDLSKATREQSLTAVEIMTNQVVSLNLDNNLETAKNYLKKYQFRHFPIVNPQKQIMGIISDRDILALKSHLKNLAQTMSQYVLVASIDTSLKSMCETMFRQHIGALPIVNNKGVVIGIVTRSDILGAIVNHGHIEFWN